MGETSYLISFYVLRVKVLYMHNACMWMMGQELVCMVGVLAEGSSFFYVGGTLAKGNKVY